jgi:hypothetical protein
MGVPTWHGFAVGRAWMFIGRLAATMDRDTGEPCVRRLPGETSAVVAFCAGFAGSDEGRVRAGPFRQVAARSKRRSVATSLS